MNKLNMKPNNEQFYSEVRNYDIIFNINSEVRNYDIIFNSEVGNYDIILYGLYA